MGSVFVSWNGTVRDRAVQRELVEFLHELADHSEARLRGPAPKRPAFLEMLTAQREQNAFRRKPIEIFDYEISGRIVLDPCLVQDGQQLMDDVQRTKTELVPVQAGGTEKPEAFCFSLNSADAQSFLLLPRLQLYGIAFQLYDPRGLYPSADRMSFVFLQNPELPSLDGCLVQIESRDECKGYQSEVIQTADWYVSAPNIHLRYYLEDWTDFLLSWVKYFFVPNLVYHRYETLSQYEAMRTAMEDLCQEHGDKIAKLAFLGQLVDMFEAEADECVQQIGGMS